MNTAAAAKCYKDIENRTQLTNQVRIIKLQP